MLFAEYAGPGTTEAIACIIIVASFVVLGVIAAFPHFFSPKIERVGDRMCRLAAKSSGKKGGDEQLDDEKLKALSGGTTVS